MDDSGDDPVCPICGEGWGFCDCSEYEPDLEDYVNGDNPDFWDNGDGMGGYLGG